MAPEPVPAWLADFGVEASEAIKRAELAAIRLEHNYVGSEHLLLGLVGAPSLREAFDGWLSPAGARDAVEAILGKPRRDAGDDAPRLTPRARTVLERAHEIAMGLGGPPVTGRHLLLAILELDDAAIAILVLDHAGVDRAELLARVREGS